MNKKEKENKNKPLKDETPAKDTAEEEAVSKDAAEAKAGAAPQETEEKASASQEDALRQQLDAANDSFLRLNAEYLNYKRRSELEKQKTYNDSKADTVKELLPVIDDLERALANETEDCEAFKKGIEMTFAKLTAALEKLGIQAFGEPGDIFDPNLHHAVQHIEDENYKTGEIVEAYQKGYKIGDKIVRPAMVKTAN